MIQAILKTSFLISLLTLSSCATMNSFLYKNKCNGGSEKLGMSDGKAFGQAIISKDSQDSFNTWSERCSQFQVSLNKSDYLAGLESGYIEGCKTKGKNDASKGLDFNNAPNCTDSNRDAAYSNGYTAGLSTYCSTTTAKNIGLKGDEYNGKICPEESKPELRKAYLVGKLSKGLMAKRDEFERDIKGFEAKLKKSGLPSDLRTEYTNAIVDRKVKIQQINNALTKAGTSDATKLDW